MSTCIGQDTSAFFVLSAEDIRYNNIQNLEEALDLLQQAAERALTDPATQGLPRGKLKDPTQN